MKKRRRSKGFTLVETLASMVILIMLVSVIGTGVSASMKTYRDLTFVSESDILASTIYTAMSDVLRFADYEAEQDGTIYFTNVNYGISKGYIFLQNGMFMIYLGNGNIESTNESTNSITENYAAKSLTESSDDPYTFYIVNKGSYTSMSIVESTGDDGFSMTYDEDQGVFSGSYTIQDRTGEFKKKETFAFRTLKAKRGG